MVSDSTAKSQISNVSNTTAKAPLSAFARSNWIAITLALIASVFGSALTIAHGETASPIDELVYIDYTYKVYEQGFVRDGETFGPEVSEFVGCNNVFPHGDLGQVCAPDSAQLEKMPNEGYTTGAPYTPVYFWLTRLVGDVIHLLTGLSDVTSWRLTGSLWLAATVALIPGLLRKWGISQSNIFAVGLLFIASPFTWWTYTYLSTDVTSVLFGILYLRLGQSIIEGTRSPWWLLPLSALAGMFKITNLFGLAFVILLFIVHSITNKQPISQRGLKPQRSFNAAKPLSWLVPLLSLGALGLVYVSWSRFIASTAIGNVEIDQGISKPLGLAEIVDLIVRGPAAALVHNPAENADDNILIDAISAPMHLIAIAAVYGALMIFQWRSSTTPIIFSTAVATVLGLPALAIFLTITSGSYFDLPGRYAASLIPGVLVVIALMMRNTFSRICILAYSIMLIVAAFAISVTINTLF